MIGNYPYLNILLRKFIDIFIYKTIIGTGINKLSVHFCVQVKIGP
jgi:hypothetical protein